MFAPHTPAARRRKRRTSNRPEISDWEGEGGAVPVAADYSEMLNRRYDRSYTGHESDESQELAVISNVAL